jgi:heme A synthase
MIAAESRKCTETSAGLSLVSTTMPPITACAQTPSGSTAASKTRSLRPSNPALVSVHFLLSAAIILTSAVVLHARTVDLEKTGRQPAKKQRAGLGTKRAAVNGAPAVRIDLRVLAGLLAAVTALMLAAGTIVTGTGPLAGTEIDSHGHLKTVPRFHFSLEAVTQLHADIGWFIGALAVALVVGLRYSGAPRRTVRLGWIVLIGLGLQGIIGYVQYFNHLPAGLVWVHVALSVLIWIFVLQLYLSTSIGTVRADSAGTGGTPAEAAIAPSVTTSPPVKTPTL